MKGFKILVTNTHTHKHTQTYNYLKRYDLTSIKCWRWSLYYHYLFIKHCLLGFNSQLLLLPPFFELHLMIIHHVICLIKISLNCDTFSHNIFYSVITGQTSPSCNIPVKIRNSTFDTSKSFIKHLKIMQLKLAGRFN